jgi:hypothetical protein
MRKKIIIGAGLLAFLFTGIAHAQLSDRVNSPSTLKIGTRPVSGNMGLMLGASYNDINLLLDDSLSYEALPVINMKYYLSDENVFTLGIKWNKSKVVYGGTIDTLVNGGVTSLLEHKSVQAELLIVPGFEKHFLPTNILDAYVGIRVPLGMVRDITENNNEQVDGDYSYYQSSRNSMVYGLDGFVGVQGFVADLPISIGIEFELSGLGYMKNKSKVKSETRVTTAPNSTTTTDYTYYTAEDETPVPNFNRFSSLSDRKFDITNDFRIAITYYFKR